MTSSYQRRLSNIKYLEQCIEELEGIAHGLAGLLKENNIKIPLFGQKGIIGDHYLTPYNMGDFVMKLITTMRVDWDKLE